MSKITLTLDLNSQTIQILEFIINQQTGGKAPEAEAAKPKAPKKSKEPKPELENPPEEAKVTLSDVRTIATSLSKAGKREEIKEIFTKYGAEKLTDISQENYPALLVDLEALSG